MKFSAGSLFATLALTAYLPGILAVGEYSPGKGSVAMFRRELASNGTAAANGTEAVDAGNIDGINIGNNDLEGGLLQNIEGLLLGLGVCNFDLGQFASIGVNSQIQLLLQLQQLVQLQQLGIVNSFSIEQLLQQELLLNNFSLNILKRTINASVTQAARENKRVVMTKRECKSKDN
ncbi:hypothetical protein GGR54DRAFT_464670 [Hypoxylon sp. NC1633]|nr:hypothetical protein GGR54DRAFT_464670 [Hypoxylon sp. NC1633]